MILTNTYDKGMMLDPMDFLSPDGTYRIALNARMKDSTLVNEEANELFASFGGTIKGHSYIDERNQTLFFVYTGNSEIWLMSNRTGEVKKVCSDNEFNCKWDFDRCEFLYGEFKSFNKCNELHVYWSSNCVYHVVNIDEMLNEKRKQAVIESEDCTYFDVFRATCSPHMSAIGAKNGGSKLESGVIQFAIQLQTNDGGVSNVFGVTEKVVLESEDNVSGQPSISSAKLRIEGLDKRWNNVIIYVIHTVGQITTIKRMPAATYGDSGFTFEYYGQDGEIVDVSTIINKSKVWLRGQDLIQKDGRMLYYNIKNEKNLNYQKYANAVELEWVEYEVTIEQQLKYHYPSLLRGEIYAFGIVWNYADGTHSPVFHIPGVPSASSGSSSQAQSGGSNVGGNPLGNSPGNAVAPAIGSSQMCSDGSGNCVECSYCDECSPCQPPQSQKTGNVASGGEEAAQAPTPQEYNPVKVENLDTSNQHERKRNPSEPEDRKNSSDKFEDQIRENVNNIDTNEQSIIDAAECQDTPYGCDQAKTAMENDINDVFGGPKSNAELLAGYGKDDPDPDVNTTGSLKESAVKLIDDAVTNREYVTKKRPVLNYTQTSVPSQGETPGNPEADLETEIVTFDQTGSGKLNIEMPVGSKGTIRGDNWVDSLGNPITEQRPRVIGRGKFEPYTSVVQYPDNKDCDGELFFQQGPITHHRVPWTSDRPHYVSYQNGVVNKYQPDNYEYGKTFIRLMGVKASNIQFPSDDELPKPLCPRSPFKLVYVERTDSNKTIFAKGWLSGVFTGSIYGDVQAFPRHGVNSFERVDRHIAAGDDGMSRLGEHSDDPVYTFHSPDTDADNSFLPVTKVKGELALKGSGWTHGHYAVGEKPQNPFTGKRRDQRGTRVSNNLNHYDEAGAETDVVGFSYAPADSVVTKPPGMSYTLNNRYRESSVYIQTTDRLPGDDRDKSFIGSTLDHFFPTECNAPYVALYREVPDLYGSVEGLRYIDLGINATQVHAQGTKAIEGICGDTWIGPYSKRRTSYVSNKQGDFFNPPPKPGSPCRERSWCEMPEDVLMEYMGIDYYPTKFPESGDIYDPKNYAGLHTIAGECGALGLSRTAADAAGIGDSESDFYWPRTLKSLVHTIVESHVNPALLQTGPGSQVIEGKVYYPKLKDLYLDSDAPNKHPWEKSYLNRFYCLVEQPSKSSLTLKAAIRTFINMVIPAALLSNFTDMEAIIDTAATLGISAMLMAFWVVAANVLFTDKRLNQLLGIGECLRDEEGGDLDEHIEQFEDAYVRYNWDYSKPNNIQPYFGFTFPYNTCACDQCSKSKTNTEIYYSDKQNLDSEIDSFRTVRMNNYGEVPANAGRIQRLFIQNGALYAHTVAGLWMLRNNSEDSSNQIAFQQAGTGQWFADPIFMFEGAEGGFAGTQHPNAAINTPYGYFFIDDIAKRIYRFDGKAPEDISAIGMKNFFKDNLGFCNPLACFDEKTSRGIHYALGYDPRYDRLLVTKQDGNPANSFTMSYRMFGQDGGAWISFHSYHPQAYLWDRNNFFSINYGNGTVWKHNISGKYQTYYGTTYPFMVEFVTKKEGLMPFTFESLQMLTYAEKDGLRGLDVTFNKLAVWNSAQGTGWLEILPVSDNYGQRLSQQFEAQKGYDQIKFVKTNHYWSANGLKDLIKDDCREQPLLITESSCQPIPDINQQLFDCTVMSKQGISNRELADLFLTYRYVFDDRNDTRLTMLVHRTNDTTKQ